MQDAEGFHDHTVETVLLLISILYQNNKQSVYLSHAL